MSLFLEPLSRQSPTLASHGGVFTTYGKVYCDCGHIEIAAIECDSPYVAPLIMERLQMLAAQAVTRMAERRHSTSCWPTTITRACSPAGVPTWGNHENYLVDQHPSSFTEEILPFLVTRIYGGAGGVHHPTGRFVAGVRSTCMQMASGGGTTDARAIHSLARDEHHMGPSPTRYRYHLILRGRPSQPIQSGRSSSALPHWPSRRRRPTATAPGDRLVAQDFSPDWLTTLREVNCPGPRGRPARDSPAGPQDPAIVSGGRPPLGRSP